MKPKSKHMSLTQASHYEACLKEGMTEEQIEKDWQQVLIDLERFHAEIMGVVKKKPGVME